LQDASIKLATKSEFGKLKLEAVWGPTALQGLEGDRTSELQPQMAQQTRYTNHSHWYKRSGRPEPPS
jgi:hypothetical protein